MGNLKSPLVRKWNATWTTLKLEAQGIQLSWSCCFSLRAVPCFDNAGQRKGKNEGNRRRELAKQILPDQGQRAVNAHQLPGELLGAATSRRTLLFLTPEVWFQFMIRVRESIPGDWFGHKKRKRVWGEELISLSTFLFQLPSSATLGKSGLPRFRPL